jgi:hypothetical protein
LSQATLPNIIDLSAQTPSVVHEPDRGNFTVKLLVLHDTVGSTRYPDRNDLGLDSIAYQSRENGTIRWFQGGGDVSVHYLVGPEATGAKIYRLCQESWTAYHAGGTANYPASWKAPDGTFYQGQVNGVGIINWISIGIERWGGINDAPGPNQTNAMVALATDIARRYNLAPEQIVAHKELEGDRQDGGILLSAIRKAVEEERKPKLVPVQAESPVSPPPEQTPADIQVQTPAQNPPADPNQKSPSDLISAGLTPPFGLFVAKRQPKRPLDIQGGAGNDPATQDNGSNGPINIGGTLSQGVSGVVPYLGAGVVKNNAVIVREKPSTDATPVRSLNQGTALRLSAYTDNGANSGSGPRWYLIDAADGGGWIYGGALN